MMPSAMFVASHIKLRERGEQGFDTGPIDKRIDLLHSFDGPITFQRGKQRDIS
jgi:hypothetical protein